MHATATQYTNMENLVTCSTVVESTRLTSFRISCYIQRSSKYIKCTSQSIPEHIQSQLKITVIKFQVNKHNDCTQAKQAKHSAFVSPVLWQVTSRQKSCCKANKTKTQHHAQEQHPWHSHFITRETVLNYCATCSKDQYTNSSIVQTSHYCARSFALNVKQMVCS